MQCALKSRDTGKCPYSECECKISKKGFNELDQYEAFLQSIYLDIQWKQDEEVKPTHENSDGNLDYGIISLILLTGERLTVAIDSSMTVAELKEKIEEENKIPANQQILVYKQNELKVSTTIT